jgi:low temperature requirement protein LtrA
MTLLPPDTAGEVAEKRVTWAELFFDLVFVFAVTQVSALLHADHTWSGMGRALVVFVPMYWGWVGTSINANLRDVDNPLDRVAIFAIGLCCLFLALATPDAYGGRGLLFGASYCAIRLILAGLFFHGRRWSLHPFAVSAAVTGPLLLLGGLVHGDAREAIWACAALTDLAIPTLMRSRVRNTRFHTAHLPERYGILVLIALGESIVAIGGPAAQAPDLTAGVVGSVTAAFVLACGLWWVYFVFATGAIQHALEIAEVQSVIVRHVLSWAHLAFVAGIICMSAGMTEVVARPGEALSGEIAGLMFGGVALYLATFNYTRWQMFRIWSKTRTAGAIATVVLAPLATQVPGVAALSMLAAVVVALNAEEYRRYLTEQRRGRGGPGER